MEKKKKTFAQRAKDLKTKYSRASFDSIERDELNKALKALMIEQEEYKKTNKLDEYSKSNKAKGGKMYAYGGPGDPPYSNNIDDMKVGFLYDPNFSNDYLYSPTDNTGVGAYNYMVENFPNIDPINNLEAASQSYYKQLYQKNPITTKPFGNVETKADPRQALPISNKESMVSPEQLTEGYNKQAQELLDKSVTESMERMPVYNNLIDQYLQDDFVGQDMHLAEMPTTFEEVTTGKDKLWAPQAVDADYRKIMPTPKNTFNPNIGYKFGYTPDVKLTPGSGLNERLTDKSVEQVFQDLNGTNTLPMDNTTAMEVAASGIQRGASNLKGNQSMQEKQYSPIESSILPSVISGGTSALSNLLLAATQPKPRELSLTRMTPEQISMARSREAARREAERAKRITRTNARNVSSGSNRMANVIAGETSVDRNLSNLVNQSYLQEETANAQERARVRQINAELEAREKAFNLAKEEQYNNDIRSYLTSAVGTVPAMMRDIQSTRRQDQMMNIMGNDYGLYQEYDPTLTRWQRMMRNPSYSILPRRDTRILNQ